MGNSRKTRIPVVVALTASLGLTACDETGQFNLGEAFSGLRQGTAAEPAQTTVRTEARDVESPEVFEARESGLWDGRPSLGGVWVAHPDVKEPERVVIRNSDNGKFVVGALFRREREIPGPRLQVSSDAATELGLLAGAPAQLHVVALRREEIEIEEAAPTEVAAVQSAEEISEAPLDPIAAAEAAIEAAPNPGAPSSAITPAATTTAAAAPTPKPAPSSNLRKPYIQVGIFSVEANADRVARQMRGAGMVPTVDTGQMNSKPFWRVIVGPAATAAERNELQNKIRGEGFSDAYPVTN